MGYCEVGYRVLINNKIVVARHVDIVESGVQCIGFKDYDSVSEYSSDSEHESIENETELIEKQKEIEKNEKLSHNHEPEKVLELRRSSRERKPKILNDYVYSNFIYVNFCSANSPESFEEAINSAESNYWEKAMSKEIDCLNKNKTWELVDKQVDYLVMLYFGSQENKRVLQRLQLSQNM
ncbi:uncharacterized protein LOC124790091 [Schistocerca piceifrons]|uniref:uncharacterized protein LOC124790091 n=1 Tax=Schistocerca piceifrons TaxID=274613 RepID=UPI001F5FDF27|nr:uncharacterized protein LOC124790091 [Schistocerca piceifrons]